MVVQSTAPTITGEFFLARVAPGNYDVALTADGCATTVIAAVPVATDSIVILNNNVSPITWPTSATHTVSGTATLSPASTTEVAYVAAKQTFGTAPIVTVKFVAADDSTTPPGAYTLTLPIGAPLLGQYSATLPIVPVAQAGVAGIYSVEASATGYQTQSVSNVNISAGDATQTFTLCRNSTDRSIRKEEIMRPGSQESLALHESQADSCEVPNRVMVSVAELPG